MDKIEYISINKADVEFISDIHKFELGVGVLSLFGSKFLEAMYFNLLLSDVSAYGTEL